jgi:hypothetical protein
MFCWVKLNDIYNKDSLNAIMGQHRYNYNGNKGCNMGLTIKYVSSTTGYVSVNTSTSSGRTFNTYCGKTLLSTGIWYHLGYTYDGTTIRLYVNGVEDGSHNLSNMVLGEDYFGAYMWSLDGTSLGTRSVYPNYVMTGCLNDIRIYNHTLSLKEIKELSKALVLHYTFDNSSFEPTTNVNTVSGWGTFSAYWTISEKTETGLKLYRHTGSTSDCVAIQNSDVTSKMAQDDIWTFSCYLYKNGQPWKSTASGISSEGYGYKTVSWESHDDGYYSITFQVTSSPGAWVLHNYFFSPIDIGVDCEMRYMQFEKKDHATIYTPTSRTSHIGDGSGLGNDGALVLPEYYSFTQDSILGTGALYSAGNSDGSAYIKTNLNPSFIAGTGTICFWYKKNTGSAGFLVATPDPGSQTHYLWANSPGEDPWNGGGASYSHWYIDGVQGKTPVSDTDWHFYCIAGVNISGWTSFAIQRHGDGSWLYRGKIADFRVYNTVLDSNEIQTMYKTRWAATRQGQVFSNAINEGQSKFQITRSGINNCSEIIEHPNLPSGYTALDKIWLGPGDRIATYYTPNQNTGIAIEFELTDTANDKIYVFGAGGANYTDRTFELYPYSGDFDCNFGNNSGNIGTLVLNKKIRFIRQQNKVTMYINGAKYTAENTINNFISLMEKYNPHLNIEIKTHNNTRYLYLTYK